MTLDGPGRAEIVRLAAEKGLTFQEKGDELSIVITAATPEEALSQLGLLTGIIAPKA